MRQNYTCLLMKPDKQLARKKRTETVGLLGNKKTFKVQPNYTTLDRQKIQIKPQNKKHSSYNNFIFKDAIKKFKLLFDNPPKLNNFEQLYSSKKKHKNQQQISDSRSKSISISKSKSKSKTKNKHIMIFQSPSKHYRTYQQFNQKYQLKLKDKNVKTKKSKDKISLLQKDKNKNIIKSKQSLKNKKQVKNQRAKTDIKTERNIEEIYRKSQKAEKLLRNQNKQPTQMDVEKVESVIVYDFSPEKEPFVISKDQYQNSIKLLKSYFIGFCQYRKYNKAVYKSNISRSFAQSEFDMSNQRHDVYRNGKQAQIIYSQIQSNQQIQKKSRINTFQMMQDFNPKKMQLFFRSEQQKWLKLKEKLQKIRDQGSSQNIQSLIKQVQNNHHVLKNIQISDLKMSKQDDLNLISGIKYTNDYKNRQNQNQIENIKRDQKSEHFQKANQNQNNYFFSHNENKQEDSQEKEKSSKFIRSQVNKKLSYDEAPLQIKKILKRKSKQQLIQQSENISRELSEKKIFLDEDIGNYLPSKFMKQQVAKYSSKPQLPTNILVPIESSLSKTNEINPIYFNFTKQQKNKVPLFYDEPQQKDQTSLLLSKSVQKIKQQLQQKISNDDFQKIEQNNNQKQVQLNYFKKEEIFLQEKQQKQNEKKQKLFQKNISQQQIQIYEQNNHDNHSNHSKEANKIIEQKEEEIIQLKQQYVYQIQFYIVDCLLIEFENDLRKNIRQRLFDQHNRNTIQIQSEQDEEKEKQEKFQAIQSDTNYVLNLSTQMLDFIQSNQQKYKEFCRKIVKPLGFTSRKLLRQMRNIRLQNQQQDYLQFDEQDQEDIYEHILSLEQVYEFENARGLQIQNNQMNHFQQIYNQSVFDAINNFLDQIRPYGQRGMPPICFPGKYQVPSLKKIKKHVCKKLKQNLQIKMGFLNYDNPIQTRQIVLSSLETFLKGCSNEFEKTWFESEENKFDICFDLMQLIEQEVINREVIEIHSLFPQF